MSDIDQKKMNAIIKKQRYERLMHAFPIKLTRTKGKGRCVVAADEIKPGTLIMEETPVAFALFKDSMGSACSFCLHSISKASSTPCPECRKQTFYCSSGCQEKDVTHGLECEIVTHLPGISGAHSVDYSLIRLIVRFIATRSLVKESSTADTSTLLDLIECVRDMIGHKASAGKLWLKSITNAATDLMETFPQIDSSVEEIIQLACQINSNSFVLYDPMAPQQSELGVSLLPLSGLFNHSCTPNAIMSTDSSGRNILRTLKTISKGEELTISYIDLYLPVLERRGKLLETKNFWCSCVRCEFQQDLDAELDSILCQNCESQSFLRQTGDCFTCTDCNHSIFTRDHESITNLLIKEFESASDFIKIGNYQGALAALVRFQENQKSRVSPCHYLVFNSFSAIINCCVKLQEYSMAIDNVWKVISIMNKSHFLPENWPEKADYYYRLGELFEIQQVIIGNSDNLKKEIHDAYFAAWSIRNIAYGPQHPATLSAQDLFQGQVALNAKSVAE